MMLYDIDARLMACVDEETGEITDLETFHALEKERDNMIKNMLLLYKDTVADSVKIAAEKKRLADRQAALEAKADRLKEYLKNFMNGEKFKSPEVTVSYRRTQVVQVDNLETIEPQYLRFKAPEPDKIAIAKALKGGEKVTGARLVPNVSMIIK